MEDDHYKQQTQQEHVPGIFFCHHCQSEYRQPKLLKCLHNFCMRCLKDFIIEEANTNLVICPLCSYATPLPHGGLESLTDNSFLQRISSEYVTGIRSHLAAKSLSPQTARKLTPYEAYIATAGMERRLSEEIAHLKTANLTDEQKTVSSKGLMYKSDTSAVETPPSGYSEFRRPSVDRGDYTVSATEAVQNMSRLQSKLISLQGEALRVTYAIDLINDHMTNWHQHKDDLKLEVQQRSHQFQVAAKKIERQILSQIEGKAMENQFYAQLDRGKMELRKNLKNILHEVSVLKSIHELGKYSEINQLSPSLLGPSIGMSEVILDMLSYQLDVPTKSIEEMVSVSFGNLQTTQEESKVYIPHIRDFMNVPIEQLTSDYYQSKQDIKTRNVESTVAPNLERSRSRSTVSRRSSSVAGGPRKHVSDVGLGSTDDKEHLEQFQNARESFKNRRQEILRQGQIAREDLSPLRGDSRKISLPTYLRGRVRSLDRSSNTEERSRPLQRNARASIKKDQGDSGQSEFEVELNGKSKDQIGSFPIIEENSNPSSPQKEIKIDERVPARFLPKSPPSGDNASTEHVPTIVGQRKLSLGSSSHHSSFDETPSLSPPAESTSWEIKGVEGSRHLRKALSCAADKRSKLEFLRDNWQKRKEILIQSRGFVSSDSTTVTGKPKTDNSASSSKSLPAEVQLSDSQRKDIRAVTQSNVQSSDKVILPNQEKQEQEKSEFSPSLATLNVSARSVSAVSHIASTHLSLEDKSIGKGSMDDTEEEEISEYTETIPITGQFLKEIRANNRVQQTGQQNVENQVDGDEETTFTTETFVLGQNQMSKGMIKDPTHSTFHSSSEVGSKTENESSISTTITKPMTSYSALRKTLGYTTTSTLSSVSTLQTSMPSGATPTEASTSLIKSDTTSLITSSISSPVARKTSTLTTTASSTMNTQPSTLYTSGVERTTSAYRSQISSVTSAANTLASTTIATTSIGQIVTTKPLSPTTSTTNTSYLGKPSRRYIPRTESVDVAALLANMYKPSPSIRDQENKKNDEEKENVKNVTEKQGDTKRQEEGKTQSIIPGDRGITKDRLQSTSLPYTTRCAEITSKLGKSPSGDSSHARTKDITVYKITGKDENQQNLENIAVASKNQAQFSYEKLQKNSIPATTESKSLTKEPRKVSFSEPIQPKDSVAPSIRDQKVDEMFTQAESNRKRIVSSSPKSSDRSRRHTIEISKTISEGTRTTDSETAGVSTCSSQAQMSLQQTNVGDTPSERLKDSKMETLTPRGALTTTGSSSLYPIVSSPFKPSGQTIDISPEIRPKFMFASSSRSLGMQPESTSSSPSSPMSASAMSPSISQSSVTDSASGQSNAGLARGKLRDIARKKKERWRRLTIT